MRLLIRYLFLIYGFCLLGLTGWYSTMSKSDKIIHALLYVAQDDRYGREVYWMDINGSHSKNLAQHVADDIAPKSYQDGIVFMSDRNHEGHELFTIPFATDTTPKNVLRLPEDDQVSNLDVSSPHVSPHGDWMIYTANHGNNSDIYRLDFDTLEQTRLTAGAETEYTEQITRKGNWILYLGDSGAFYRMRVDGSQKENLSQKFNIGNYAVLSADGSWLVYERLTNNSALYRTRLVDQYTEKLLDINPGSVTALKISPDGKSIYFLMNDVLYRSNMDGTGKKTIIPAGNVSGNYYLLSPEGHWIFFNAYKNENIDIYRVRSDGTDITRLTDSIADEFVIDTVQQNAQPTHTIPMLVIGVILILIPFPIRRKA
jgi:Tol biopolymer transport system component